MARRAPALVAVLLPSWTMAGCDSCTADDLTPRYAPHLDDYLARYDAPCIPARSTPGKCLSNAFRRGKVLIIDVEARKVDAAQKMLDARLQPSGPDDVQTLALLEWTQGPGGTYRYDDGTTGNVQVWTANVRLIDLETGYRSAELVVSDKLGPVDVKLGEKPNERPKPRPALARAIWRVGGLRPGSWLAEYLEQL